jgi:bla regulator protein blaR1
MAGMGRPVVITNRTGLEGRYSIKMTYRIRPLNAAPDAAADDTPDLFTALQEQAGLKLVPEKMVVPVFVIDHIERPSEN